MNELSPLVSIVIITYNSSTTIVETLDSVKRQTYSNIELIVSDDCSADNTVEVVKGWMERNKSRFVRAKLIESDVNTGVAVNLNRGNKDARGIWLKSIAGDDTLEPIAIEEYVRFCESKKCEACVAKMNTFGVDEIANKRNSIILDRMYEDLQLATREKQYRTALKRHIMPAPGTFFRKAFVEEIGGYNEKYPSTEEYDFELRVLDRTKFYFLDKYLVNWRIRPDSLCHSVKKVTTYDDNKIDLEVKIPRLLKEHMYLYVVDTYLSVFLRKNANSRLYPCYRLLLLLSPIRVVSMINKLLKIK